MSMQDLLRAQLTKNMLGMIASMESLPEKFLNQGGVFQQKKPDRSDHA
jgi:hypothetical protein